jgi:hypothetical protein
VRGHHAYCDEVRAFSLKTGASFAVSKCVGITDAPPVNKATVGRVPLPNLREAALMLMLSTEVQPEAVWETSRQPVPVGMVAQRYSGGIYLGSAGYSSGSSTLLWTWVRNGTAVAGGTVVYPENYNDAALDHAVRLLRIVEAAAVDGCTPEALGTIPFDVPTKPPGFSKSDPLSFRDAPSELVENMRALATSAKRCR